MRNVNYKSDFDFYLVPLDATGSPVPIGDFDWRAVFWTSVRGITYEASRIDGVLTNCHDHGDGRIHIPMDSHGLPTGRLKCEFTAYIPDSEFDDRIREIHIPQELDITLTVAAGDVPTELVSEIDIAVIKGQPFRYEDFTPEQLLCLSKPIADRLQTAFDTLASEVKQVSDKTEETVRDITEKESARESEESARQLAEAERTEAEQERCEAELQRAQAEVSRSEAFDALMADAQEIAGRLRNAALFERLVTAVERIEGILKENPPSSGETPASAPVKVRGYDAPTETLSL